jgi:hypothetical protein
MMICYNVSHDVVDELVKRNYKVFAFQNNEKQKRFEYAKQNFNICLERFWHIWQFLNNLPNKDQYRYIISTDVRDVVFQSNPSEWLEKNIKDKKLNVACESIKYKDEPWGQNNLKLSFGNGVYEQMKDNLIYNAGTISGEFKSFLDMCLNLYLLCGHSPENVPGGGGPDQAALNVLLNFEAYKYITNFAMSEDGYASQLGTTGQTNNFQTFKPFLVEPIPMMIDGVVCTSTGKPFSIVHQYDRVTEWKNIIEKRYE